MYNHCYAMHVYRIHLCVCVSVQQVRRENSHRKHATCKEHFFWFTFPGFLLTCVGACAAQPAPERRLAGAFLAVVPSQSRDVKTARRATAPPFNVCSLSLC